MQQNHTACSDRPKTVTLNIVALGTEDMRRDEASLANDHLAPALSWLVINVSREVKTSMQIIKNVHV
jgi:hypothetical protein